MAQLNFDATQYNPEQGTGQFSPGRHLVVIEGDEIKKANGSDGGYLEFKLKGVNQSQGEQGAYRLNLYNNGANAAKTVEIANRHLSAVCYAVGVLGINGDTSVLWNLPFMIDVAYQKGHNPATDGEEAKGYTEIKRVLTANGEEIKAGMQPGGSGGGQQTAFGQGQAGNFQQPQQQQQQQQVQQPNQQQQNFQQQQPQQQGNVQFGQQPNQQQQQPNQQQQGNNGQWQPGQGQPQQGQQWQPRSQ